MFSIMLIGNIKIDITEAEVPKVVNAINSKVPVIKIGKRFFAHHQFANILPKEEADFIEKTRLREKGFYKCRKYGTVHKLGDLCDCKDTGNIDPRLVDVNNLLKEKNT